MSKKEYTYEILHEIKLKQDKLIVEGKMQRPKRIIRDFTPEEQKMFDNGLTFEQLWNKVEKNLGMK